MRIGVDIRSLSDLNDQAGIYQSAWNMVTHMLRIAPEHDYALLSTRRGPRDGGHIAERHLVRIPAKLSNLLLERLSVPVECLLGPLEVFYGPSFVLPRILRGKGLVTVHDMMFFRHPEFLRPDWVANLRTRVRHAAGRADAVVAVSEFTKREIVEWLGVPRERIRVVPNGVGPQFSPIKDPEHLNRVMTKHGIPGPYVLFVGRVEAKKNLGVLIRAWHEVRQIAGLACSLVVVGKRAEHFPATQMLIEQLHAERHVIFTDVVEGSDLPALYSGAEVFVFPSLYEGFGIPVLEAMACGTPVIASSHASIPEVAGEAAVLVDPTRVEALAAAIHKVLIDSDLRRHLIQRGFQRAKEFSWEASARAILHLCEELGPA